MQVGERRLTWPVNPVKPGVFLFELPLEDSLKLKLDATYTLSFRKPGEETASDLQRRIASLKGKEKLLKVSQQTMKAKFNPETESRPELRDKLQDLDKSIREVKLEQKALRKQMRKIRRKGSRGMGKEVGRISIPYSDYELKHVVYKLETDGKEHYPEVPLVLTASATDENDLPVADVKLELKIVTSVVNARI